MHKSFFSFEAENHYELGLKMGKHFKKEVQERLSGNKDEGFKKRLATAKKMFDLTKDHFPEYIHELKGWADGANVDLYELWTLTIEDDAYIEEKKPAKCTTIITNGGKLLAHSEDWKPNAKDDVRLVKKTVDGLTTFEIYYLGTLGGASIGLNSNGFAMGVNTLLFSKTQIGIPKSILARKFLDTNNPKEDFEKVKSLKIADGYSHNIINTKGEVVNIEMSVNGSIFSRPASPMAHSNHCLTLKDDRKPNEDDYGTLSRLKFAEENISEQNSISEIQELLENNSKGPDKSINNERTVGRMIIDLDALVAYVWLLREEKLGWVKYPLDFIKK